MLIKYMNIIIKNLFIAISFYLLIGYINQFVSENQVYHNINEPPLFDRLHNLLPFISKKIPDIGLFGFLIYFIIRWGIKYPSTIVNYLWIIGFLFIGRVIVLSVTQLPPAVPNCSTVKPGAKLHFILFKEGWNTCIDYMYSGHTLHCVLVALFTVYLSNNMFEKIIIIMALLIEMLLIIASRIHYTSDVLIATLISILIFFSWPGLGNIKNHINSGGMYGSTLKNKLL
jgi:hypothetical protein